MRKLLAGAELRQRCHELGVDTTEVTYGSRQRIEAGDDVLQRRLLEAQRSRRERGLWILAVLSAIAPVVSALAAAWLAVWR